MELPRLTPGGSALVGFVRSFALGPWFWDCIINPDDLDDQPSSLTLSTVLVPKLFLQFSSLRMSFFLSVFSFWLHRVLVVACGIFHCGMGSLSWHAGFSLVVARGICSCGTRTSLSLRHASLVVVACGLSCPMACGILAP